MIISELIKELEFKMRTYGDIEVRFMDNDYEQGSSNGIEISDVSYQIADKKCYVKTNNEFYIEIS